MPNAANRPPLKPSRKLLLAAAAALALPSIAFAQGQVDVGHSNEANNRVGSGGRNGGGTSNLINNSILNNGNRVVTGNVTMGREFRGNVGYTDPYAFRGTTAGSTSDNFVKNSAGVPQGNAPAPIPNKSTSFYGVSQTVQPPPGFELTANREGYVPPPPTAPFRGGQDQRLGVINLNQPLGASAPAPGELITPGNLNPTSKEVGMLTASPLYAFRQWNPNDPADRAALESIMSRQNAGLNRAQIDPRELKRLQDELSKAIGGDQLPSATDVTQPQQGAITPKPLGSTLETPTSPAINNTALTDQLANKGMNADLNTDQAIRFNRIGAARRTSTQYSELSKRLEQFYASRPKTDADFAREFNAEKAKAEAVAKAAAAKKNPGAIDANPAVPPVKPDPNAVANDPTKPKVKKPTPIKITTLSQGVRAEGLANIMKKAESLMKEGKYTSALDQYDQAEAVAPNNPMLWLGRANAELGAGFFARADDHIRLAMNTDKALLMGQYDLTAMLGEDRLTKLVAELKDIATKENKPSPLFLLAYIAYNTGHERQALGYLDLAEKRGGDQAGFYKTLRDRWALPEPEGKPDGTKPDAAKPDAAKPDAAPAKPDTGAKPELNK